ncbi:MAG TPA: hypothetical protein V6C85_21505 [Allocoleopsis sp.]
MDAIAKRCCEAQIASLAPAYSPDARASKSDREATTAFAFALGVAAASYGASAAKCRLQLRLAHIKLRKFYQVKLV